ncbi:MAG: hypothetical protein ACTSP9_10540 [Promethearchaeota archaeon]
METKKSNEWAIFLISLIVLFLALIFPAVSFSNRAGSINIYISGIVYLVLYDYYSALGITSNTGIIISSSFTMSTLVFSLITLSILSYYLKKDIKNFKNLKIRYFLLINAVILLIPTIVWIIQFDQAAGVISEEITELGYENIWEIFTPSFGLIGIFLSAGIIFGGVLYIQYNYLKILEKLLPSKVDKRKELNIIQKNILRELNQITNTAKERYLQEENDSHYLATLTKDEFNTYSRLNRRLDKLTSVLQKNSND